MYEMNLPIVSLGSVDEMLIFDLLMLTESDYSRALKSDSILSVKLNC